MCVSVCVHVCVHVLIGKREEGQLFCCVLS